MRLAWRECLAMAVPLLSALAELTMRDTYHQVAAEPTRFAALAAFSMVILGVAAWSGSRTGPAVRMLLAMNRLSAFAVWAWIVWMRGTALDLWIARAPALSLIILVIAAALLGWLAWNEPRWSRAKSGLLVATALFVGSQPLLAWFTASSSIQWPDTDRATMPVASVGPGGAKEGVVVLLLDELNARDGPALADALRRAGMDVVAKGITPVADGTAKVIPQIWTGLAFQDPKPCSFTAICSSGAALDFSRVTVNRPDVDVVGFYHPYCAMRGLRSCARVAMPLPLGDMNRWACAVARRVGQFDHGDCVPLQHAPWIRMQDEAVQALRKAPFWQQGGLLFAHLPLPHLPGRRAGGTMRQHYEDNVRDAATLLGDMAARLRASGFGRARLVVFSDHPLRQALWCGMPAYRGPACTPTPALEDEQIPLIVANLNVAAPDLSQIETNAQVFMLSRLPSP